MYKVKLTTHKFQVRKRIEKNRAFSIFERSCLQNPSNIARLSHLPKITLNSVSVVAIGKDRFYLYSENRAVPKEQIIAISFVAISLVRVGNLPVLISQWPPGWMNGFSAFT